VEHQCDSIALPAISTGAYRYPVDLAAEDSLSATREFLLEHQKPSFVRFVLFNEGILGAFSRVLDAMTE
jgi:O-acetyl-ADP-ribose deacetylase (regulator of RNase III)